MNKIKPAYFPSKTKANILITNNKMYITSAKWKIQNAKLQEVQPKDSSELTSTASEKRKKRNRKGRNIKIQEKLHQLIVPPNFCHLRCLKECTSQDRRQWLLDKERWNWALQGAVGGWRRQYHQGCVNLETIWFPNLHTGITRTIE